MMGLNKVIINGKDPINPLSSIYIVHSIQAQTLIYTYIYNYDHMRHTGCTINPTLPRKQAELSLLGGCSGAMLLPIFAQLSLPPV